MQLQPPWQAHGLCPSPSPSPIPIPSPSLSNCRSPMHICPAPPTPFGCASAASERPFGGIFFVCSVAIACDKYFNTVFDDSNRPICQGSDYMPANAHIRWRACPFRDRGRGQHFTLQRESNEWISRTLNEHILENILWKSRWNRCTNIWVHI